MRNLYFFIISGLFWGSLSLGAYTFEGTKRLLELCADPMADLAEVRALIDTGTASVNRVVENGPDELRPLYWAFHDADVDIDDPLDRAVCAGRPDIVALLLESGATVCGDALTNARHNSAIFSLLLPHISRETLHSHFEHWLSRDDRVALDVCINHCAQSYPETALYFAARAGRVDLVERLVLSGGLLSTEDLRFCPQQSIEAYWAARAVIEQKISAVLGADEGPDGLLLQPLCALVQEYVG